MSSAQRRIVFPRLRPRALGAVGLGAALLAVGLTLPQEPTEAAFTDTASVNMDVQTPWGTPVGAMTQHLGATAPDDTWLIADGRAVSRSTYRDLFEVIGTTYGAGNGSTTFNLPDLRGRTPVGLSSDAEFNSLGKTGGEKAHVLQVESLPSHGHDASASSAGDHNHSITVNSGGAHSHTASTGSAGAHTHSSLNVGGTQITWQNSTKALGPFGAPHGGAGGSDIATSSAGAHTHSVTVNSGGAHAHSASSATAGEHSHDVTVDATGGGQAHNNLQPYVTVNYIIKAK